MSYLLEFKLIRVKLSEQVDLLVVNKRRKEMSYEMWHHTYYSELKHLCLLFRTLLSIFHQGNFLWLLNNVKASRRLLVQTLSWIIS